METAFLKACLYDQLNSQSDAEITNNDCWPILEVLAVTLMLL